ncbi:hypothetical protein BASA81_008304 [Batrachochytrium salamandrivorans]|nr:hypothetical protein BASA81_008304 [Batrachochytrium salamandrivorans]
MSDLMRKPCLENNLLPWVSYVLQHRDQASAGAFSPPALGLLRVQIRDFDPLQFGEDTVVTVGDANFWIRCKFSPLAWSSLQTQRSQPKDFVGALCSLNEYTVRRSREGEMLLFCTQVTFLEVEAKVQGNSAEFSKHPQLILLLQQCPGSEFSVGGGDWIPNNFESIVTGLLTAAASPIAPQVPPATQLPNSELPQQDGMSSSGEEEEEKGIRASVSVLDTASTEDEEEDTSLPAVLVVPTITAKPVLVEHLFTTILPGVGIDGERRVTSLTENGPAHKAGVRMGDRIESAGGTTLFTDIRHVLEHGPLPFKLVVRRQLVGRQFLHWHGGMVYEGVVLSANKTSGTYELKYNDGHEAHSQSEEHVSWLVDGHGSGKHEHDANGKCVLLVSEGGKEGAAMVVEEEEEALPDAAMIPATQFSHEFVVEDTQFAHESGSFVEEYAHVPDTQVPVSTEPEDKEVVESSQRALSPPEPKRPRLKRIKSSIDDLWDEGFVQDNQNLLKLHLNL